MGFKITALPTTTVNDADYVPVANTKDGTRKVRMEDLLSAANPTIDSELSTTSTNAVQNKAVAAAIEGVKRDLENVSGLSDEAKTALLACFRNVAWIGDDGQDYYDALYDALYAVTSITLSAASVTIKNLGGTAQLTATTVPAGAAVSWESSDTSVAIVSSSGLVTSVGYGAATITATAGSCSATCTVLVSQAALSSISAVFTQGDNVIYDTDSLDTLKQYLVVTAAYSDGSTAEVTDYTLSGTLTEGTSTITVSYASETTTFTVTVTRYEITLDTIIYEGKSYRDIFITANQLHGFDFENGLPSGCTTNAGSPSITDEDYYSYNHSVKAFGATSAQYKSVNTTDVADWNRYSGKQYFGAFKAKCTRYTKGSLGVSGMYPSVPAIQAVTDGWVTAYAYETSTAGHATSTAYIGSYSSADLDGYIDDIVLIPMSDVFTVIPSEADMLSWYNAFCDILKEGGE